MSETQNWDEDLAVLPDQPPVTLPRGKLTDDEMDITPMIDITFLLLIFFLVASKMTSEAAVELPKARHGTAVVSKNSVIVLVKRGSEDQALVARGDGQPFSNDLKQQETEIAEYVETEMSGDSAKQHVLIKAERGVKHREVSRVARAVGAAAEGRQLHIAVMDVH